MNFLRQNITTILLIAIAVFVTLQVQSCFSKVHKPESMIRNEERIKYLEQDRLKDSVAFIERENFYDSSLKASAQRYDELENKKQPIYNAIKNVTTVVDNLDKQQLSDASAEYYKKHH